MPGREHSGKVSKNSSASFVSGESLSGLTLRTLTAREGLGTSLVPQCRTSGSEFCCKFEQKLTTGDKGKLFIPLFIFSYSTRMRAPFGWNMAATVVRRRWAHAPAIHSASHVREKKSCMGVDYVCLCVCSYIVMVLCYHTTTGHDNTTHKLKATELLSLFSF